VDSSSPSLTSFGARPVQRRPDRLARVFDQEVYPLFGQRLGEMLLRGTPLRPRASVLEIGCAAGALTGEITHRLGPEGRVVALDASAALLDLARARVRDQEPVGRRAFFRTHTPEARLPFDDASFDFVLANVSLGDLPDPEAAVADWARVARPGGEVVLATPLRGTWGELLDLFREVLVRLHRDDAMEALDAYLRALPDRDTVVRLFHLAGLRGVTSELDHWDLVFRSAREFFYAPVIEQGPLERWKDVAGRGASMHDVFHQLKQAIDTYFAGRAFSVGVFAGRFAARKPDAR